MAVLLAFTLTMLACQSLLDRSDLKTTYTVSAPDKQQRPFWPNKELDNDELVQQHTDLCFEMRKTVA